MIGSMCLGSPTCGLLPGGSSLAVAAAIDWANLDWVNVRHLIIAAAVLAGLLAVAVYVVGKVRAWAVQKEPPASELLTKFREMHSQGVLSDEEFRTIKTTLKERLQSELKDQDGTV